MGVKQAVVAAAQRIGGLPLEVQSPGQRRRAQEWQRECWDYYDSIGELKYATNQIAEAVSKVRLFVGWRPTPQDVPLDAVEEGRPGAAEAADALDRLDRSDEGLAGIQREFTINHQVAGEMYLVGDGTGDDERWEICSVDELEADERGHFIVKTTATDRGKQLSESAFVARLWQKHARYGAEADSPMRAVRTECDELLLLSRAIRGAARSRAHANLLLLPDGLKVLPVNPSDDATNAASESSISATLGAALMEPILDESHPSSVVPVMLEGDKDKIEAIRTVDLYAGLDAKMADTRVELIRRIGQGLNFPVELVMGLGATNHWTAWAINQSVFDAHVEPLLLQLYQALMIGFIRPSLVEAGIAPEALRDLVLWGDASALITQPNEAADIATAHKAMVISNAKYRSVIGAADDDAPDDAEVARRIEIAQALMKPTTVAGPDGTVIGQPPVPSGPTASATPLIAVPITASARRPVGERLAEIDRALRTRLEVAATTALRRALERAGARLRSKAAGDPAAHDAIVSAAQHDVASVLGRSVVAALGFGDPDLLDGAFDDFADQYDTWTAASQSRARRVAASELGLDDAESEDLAAAQDDQRSSSLAWLLPALGALATQRLYNPSPDAPLLGEHDPSMSVPPSLLREALARAGGADRLATADGPAGGVSTGTTLRELFAEHGRVTQGWEWVYGDSERSFPAHEDLDGVSFDTWDDDALAVQPGDEWLDVSHYAPGDHNGCRCDFIPVVTEAGEATGDDAGAEAA